MGRLLIELWRIFVLREAVRKGELNLRAGALAFLFVMLLYAIGVLAMVLWVNHPEYKPVFIAAMVLDGALFVGFMIWAIRWRGKQLAAQAAASPNSQEAQAGKD